ncbi:MAG: 2-C-methyl-D-erythritol 4-phosphate cytidylyltransferase, partial [Alphaproteobacteria bacterium]|nr:2-C-methyl-D-erythritol 4-phosphate cytidylyltransferase [Alphaproteobacteria bacterium]
MTQTTALIVAAGRGSRFRGEVPKQYVALAGEPVLRHTVRAFKDHGAVASVRVVIHPDDRSHYDAAAVGLGLDPPVEGGASRQESVRLGLESLAGDPPDYILVHDAARPLVDHGTISRVIDALELGPGAIAALPLGDSIARVADGFIQEPVDRDGLWAAQTPQGFRYAELLAAHRAAADGVQPYTDDAAVARAAGLAVAVVEGTPNNIKVTTADDLDRAAALLSQAVGVPRVGFGFDVHKFADPEPAVDAVLLCGVPVPHDRGLAGHSDADVGLHAITDAVLGAIGAGDIGDHFPRS